MVTPSLLHNHEVRWPLVEATWGPHFPEPPKGLIWPWLKTRSSYRLVIVNANVILNEVLRFHFGYLAGNKMASPPEYQTTGNQQLRSKSGDISISPQKPQSTVHSLSHPQTSLFTTTPPPPPFRWSSLTQSVSLQPASTHSLSLFSSLPTTLMPPSILPLRPQTNWGRWPLLFPLITKPLSAAVARHPDYIVCVSECVRLPVILLLYWIWIYCYGRSLHASCECVCICVSESMNMKVKS